MKLGLDSSLGEAYGSKSQFARVVTENWVSENVYCPRCGNERLFKAPNNEPVFDFFCPTCRNQYELKSKQGRLPQKIIAGAYGAMIERIASETNPDFFFLTYSRERGLVDTLMVIPNYFFTAAIVEKRKPLAETARRAGWIGCNLLLASIPEVGRIYLVEKGVVYPKEIVIEKMLKASRLKTLPQNLRGWVLDVLHCVFSLRKDTFELAELYALEEHLSQLHPSNRNVRAKIRQQLQILRDLEYLEFRGRGIYSVRH